MDQTIKVGAPSADLWVTIGSTAYKVILHDNGDGTYLLRLQTAAGAITDLSATLAELNLMAGELGDVYTLPATGIPESDLEAAVQALIDNSATKLVNVTDFRTGSVQLNGTALTPITFKANTAATILGTDNGATKALSDGLTLVVNPNGAGDNTVTFAAAAGYSTGGAGPSTDMTASTDTKLNVAYNGAAAVEVAFTWAGCNSGALIAAQMQTAIRAALTGNPAVTVAFAGGVYVITSPTAGTGSTIVITDATADNCADDLKLGTANTGVETAGTGDAANIAAATAAELAAAITAKATGWVGTAEGNRVRITSTGSGLASSLIVNAASTADTVLGISGSNYGAQGLGFSTDMADTAYKVLLTPQGVADVDVSAAAIGVHSKATTGFTIKCEDSSAAGYVDVLVVR